MQQGLCDVRVMSCRSRKVKSNSYTLFIFPQVGKWSASGGLNITEVPKRKGMNITDSLANRSLVITTILVGQLTLISPL
jgi:hypothetical protein